jgi:hypothetical protein
MPTTTTLNLITIDEYGTVIYRYRDVETQGQRVISDVYRRYPLEAGDDTTNAPANVRAICALEHTPERVAAAMARKAARG